MPDWKEEIVAIGGLCRERHSSGTAVEVSQRREGKSERVGRFGKEGRVRKRLKKERRRIYS